MKIRQVVFLGAGASKSEGVPVQNEMFRDYFKTRKEAPKTEDKMDKELASFFRLMFGIDVDTDNLNEVMFPTLEEVLGLTDLAIMRKEAFKVFDVENRDPNSGKLRHISRYLVFLMAQILDNKIEVERKKHDAMVHNLHKSNQLKNTAFFSTNYDILIDNALTEMYDKDIHLDYGIDFHNFYRKNDWKRPIEDKKVFLFKPHGSLNWLHCPTCNHLELTPKDDGVVTRLISNSENDKCERCNSIYMPVIVPPSYYKDFSNIFLNTVWNKAEYFLKDAEHFIFCGYSLPDADMHIKYLLKRLQVNSQKPYKITVMNCYCGKQESRREIEERRFKRFFGKSVNYTPYCFNDFASNPAHYL